MYLSRRSVCTERISRSSKLYHFLTNKHILKCQTRAAPVRGRLYVHVLHTVDKHLISAKKITVRDDYEICYVCVCYRKKRREKGSVCCLGRARATVRLLTKQRKATAVVRVTYK